MVRRWRCRHCEFTVWSASRESTVDRVKSHLLDHHGNLLSREDFRIRWECPYCDRTNRSHDEEAGVAQFGDHLFEHVEPLLETDTHVGDDVNGTGSVLVQAPANSVGADNARVHFLSPGDVVLIVTTNPGDRLRLVHEQMSEWPAWTVVLTTKENPLAGVDIPNVSDRPLEVVRIDRRMGLSQLGETISRVLSEQDTEGGKVSFEFDILSEIIDKFDTRTVFKFLHLLMERLDGASALSHYYLDPTQQSASTINVFSELFDLTITAKGDTFVADGSAHP